MISKQLKKILKPSGVVFKDDGHTYTAQDGSLYTGVTTISDAWRKDFLAPWYSKEMANYILSKPYDQVIQLDPKAFQEFILEAKGAAKRIGDKAKDDGAAAHAWAGNRICSKIDPETKLVPTPESKEAKNACTAFAHWAKGKQITWLASEEVVASHEFKFAGTADAIATIDGIMYLVDLKTSGQVSSSYLLQCAGYDVALREMGVQVMGYLILRIPKDGTDAESLTITNREYMEFFRQTFLGQREAHKFYVLMENKFKDMQTGKMKVDEKVVTKENHDTKNSNKQTVPQRGGQKRKAVRKQAVRKTIQSR